SVGASAVYASLARDGQPLFGAAQGLALLIRAGVVAAIGLAYLGGISILALLAAAVTICAAALFLGAALRPRLDQRLQESRGPEWGWYGRLQELLAAFPELRLNRLLRDSLFDRYARAAAESSTARRMLGDTIAGSLIFGQASLLLLILGAAFWGGDSSGFGVGATALYVAVELAPATAWLERVVRADALLAEWLGLEAALSQGADPEASAPRPREVRRFERICLDQAVFRYGDGTGQFVLGPLTLRLNAGEILFLTGGAGSGKTTLLKLLGGLYRPAAGSLAIDGEPLREDGGEAYRELFAGVLAGRPNPGSPPGWSRVDPATAVAWLERLGLAGKVAWSDEGYSRGPLSAGERRRLALAAAVLEDKPVLLLDEDGIDGDPEFLEHCWPRVLAELRRRGTAVVAVVRDPRMLRAADHVIALTNGRMVETP
ncbi:MAG: ATP-binding cassette domain-containing protein, partial [Methylococcus sp.]